jgi:hypothetical protein
MEAESEDCLKGGGDDEGMNRGDDASSSSSIAQDCCGLFSWCRPCCRRRRRPPTAAATAPLPSDDSEQNDERHHVLQRKLIVKGRYTESFRVSVEEDLVRKFSGRNIRPPTNGEEAPIEGIAFNSHSSYNVFSQRDLLERGGALYSFSCGPHTQFSPYDADVVREIANLTSFEDEARDNCVPIYYERDDPSYTFVIVKCAYLLPCSNMDWITPTVLASTDYQASCQPVGTDIWEQLKSDTFRMTKPIIPYLYSITVQFKVSSIPRHVLSRLSPLCGNIPLDAGLLMERTKNSKPPKEDFTRKAKSVLLYTRIDGGVLVHHFTVVLQSSVPQILAHIVHTYGVYGLAETKETVVKTRAYLGPAQLIKTNDGDDKS